MEQTPADAAVIITTILRPSLDRALASVFEQEFPGSIHLLVGVDKRVGDARVLDRLEKAPGNVRVTLLDPGYSTAMVHGGLHLAADGGALRTILSYLANSRYLAYLDDDNWMAPDHLFRLRRAMLGVEWTWSLRWFVNPFNHKPICIDEWEAIGPGSGWFEDWGGWVDPNQLMIDKVACEAMLRYWSVPLAGAPMSADRNIFRQLKGRPNRGTGAATVYYTISPGDPMHQRRLSAIAERLGRRSSPPGHQDAE